MATRVDLNDAEESLPRLLERASRDGERILVARDGEPLAAVVSVTDLERLERGDTRDATGDQAREARFRSLLMETGLIVQQPTGEPVTLRPVDIGGPSLSDEIIADRR